MKIGPVNASRLMTALVAPREKTDLLSG